MSTKKHYNLSIFVVTMAELVHGKEKVHVDIAVHAIQVVQPYTQFTDLNHTGFGFSSTNNFSSSTSSFILFGVHKSESDDALRSVVYKSVCNLIGTTNGVCSMAICMPPVKNLFSLSPGENVDMSLFTEGVIAGLQSAMKDSISVVKTNQQVVYFVVPEEMKESLALALEKVE